MIRVNSIDERASKIDTYLMTVSPDIKKMSDLEDGYELSPIMFCQFTDVKEDGKEEEILSIMTEEKEVYSTNSKTFADSFVDIYNLFEHEPFTIIKRSGKSKNNRDFIYCSLKTD